MSSFYFGMFSEKGSSDREFWVLIAFLSLATFVFLLVVAMIRDIKLLPSKDPRELKKIEKYGLVLIFSGSLYIAVSFILLGFLSIFINTKVLLGIPPIFGYSGFIIIAIGIILMISSSASKNDKNNK